MAYADLATDRPPERGVLVRTSWVEKALIEQVPGVTYDAKTGGVWRGPRAWATYVTLRAVFGDQLHVSEALAAWAWTEYQRRVQPALDLRAVVDDGGGLDTGVYDRRLYPFQRLGARFLDVATTPDTYTLPGTNGDGPSELTLAGGAVLGDDMGTGKTVTTLDALRVMHDRGEPVLPVLLVCPNGVKRHWERRVPEWFPAATAYVVPNTGSVGRARLIARAREDLTAFVILNYEAAPLLSRLAPYGSVALRRCRECDSRYGDPALSATRCEVHRKALSDFPFRTVVVDEVHRLRNPQAKWTRAVWALAHGPTVRRRVGLTGTVLGRDLTDLWSVMHFAAPLDYPVKTKWVDRVALMAWDATGGIEVVGVRPDRREEFYGVFDPRFRRVSIDVALPQLPPVVRTQRHVELTAAQRRVYKDLEARLHARNEDGQLLVVPNNLVKATRLQQLAASSVTIEKPDEDDVATWRVTPVEPSPKLDELELVLDELGAAPCAVGAEHLGLVELAAARLTRRGVPFARIDGTVNELGRDRALQALNEGKLRVLLFTREAGGEGLDFSAVGTLIFLQRSWKMISNIQSEARNRRIGAERHDVLRVVDIVTADTVEQAQLERLYQRLERLEEVNRDRLARVTAGQPVDALDDTSQRLRGSDLGLPLEEDQT